MKSKRINAFHAHSSAINCLKIGPKSGKVLVTGGHDKLVNLWAIGRATPILVGFNPLRKESFWSCNACGMRSFGLARGICCCGIVWRKFEIVGFRGSKGYCSFDCR
jgi:WD40 repeat protein